MDNPKKSNHHFQSKFLDRLDCRSKWTSPNLVVFSGVVPIQNLVVFVKIQSSLPRLKFGTFSPGLNLVILGRVDLDPNLTTLG